MNDQATVKDFADLDMNLDDIADLPGFSKWPNGAYRVSLTKMEKKAIGTRPGYGLEFKLDGIVEAPGVPEEELPKIGDVVSTAYITDNETGAGFFKEFVKPIAEKLGSKSLREVVTNAIGMQLMVILAKTPDKHDKDKFYNNVKKVAVL